MYTFLYKKPEKGGFVSKIAILFVLLAVIAFVSGALVLLPYARGAFSKMAELSPPKAKLIVILPDDCDDCFDIYQVIDFLKAVVGMEYTSIKEYKAGDKKADLLIKAHNIKIVPTFILQGKTEQFKIDMLFDGENIGKLEEKVFVYNNTFPPYYNLEENKRRGNFELIFLADKTCGKCYDIRLHEMALKNLAMVPHTTSTVETYSPEGQELIRKYNLEYTPTILLQGDMDAYLNFRALWDTLGTIEDDGTYVFRESGLQLMGTYKNIKTWALQNLET